MNEFDLIAQFFQRPSVFDASLIQGIGDDCAIVQPPQGQQLLVSTDTLVAGRHFPLQTDPYSIGWKAAAVNLSDIAAMGGTAHSLLLAISLPSADADFLQPLSAGLFDLCQQHGVQLIGGDTTRSAVLSLTVTALGFAPNGQAILRSGAQVGDDVIVTGTIGDAAYALHYPHSVLQSRLDRPQPRLHFAQAARGLLHSMLDISDGLTQDLGHILRASGVGAQVDVSRIPHHALLAQLPRAERLALMLQGGDDYELCFSCAPKHWPQLCAIAAETGTPLTRIGHIVAQPLGVQLFEQQQPIQCAQTGFLHF